ncbi:hypothetical protein ABKN59_007595 [Abortiporus biennis]
MHYQLYYFFLAFCSQWAGLRIMLPILTSSGFQGRTGVEYDYEDITLTFSFVLEELPTQKHAVIRKSQNMKPEPGNSRHLCQVCVDESSSSHLVSESKLV